MSNITDAIENVTSNMTNSINEGFRTLADLIQETMENSGAEQASAFDVVVNGVSNIYVSPDDPRLNQLVNPDDVRIRKVNTATAGV